LDVDAFGPLSDHVIFAPTRTVQVRKDFFIGIPQFGTGSVRVSDFTENFSEMPEPVGTVLIGSGLLALGIWRRRVSRG
jgi:hypothetical protein